MESVETLIPDNEGNHLVVVLNFYEDSQKADTFICSTDPLKTNHKSIAPGQYRWNLFEYFYQHNIDRLKELGIESKDIIVGSDGYQSFARVFYRTSHAPVIHLVIAHLENKYH